tara:strand:- start:8101 stop:8391 length:291 start_codon:yes stop_codon:yes gene_type:complete
VILELLAGHAARHPGHRLAAARRDRVTALDALLGTGLGLAGQALTLEAISQVGFMKGLGFSGKIGDITHSSHSPMLAMKAASQSPPIMASLMIIIG